MTEIIIDLIAWGGYLGIFLLMAAENVFPPIPSEVIMGLGGMAVARGQMELVPLILWGTVGTVVGNYFWYEIGRRLGYQRLKPFVDRHGRWLTMDWEEVEKLHRFFQRHGQWVVFVLRFMPAGRTIISLPAGMTRMPHWRFILATTAGSAIWNCILAGAGLYLGANFKELDHYVGPLAVATMVAMALFYLYRVATWKPRG
ncbi:DedA family protein [Sphingomonas endolithica]|uniref:DedA family protein n=1 Tax=Sphingomonas endolithica TaxID=2972485 RepID=UPI0021AFD65B|nr:DedA family protein [Sphingomonas sp. ZFBP2030]